MCAKEMVVCFPAKANVWLTECLSPQANLLRVFFVVFFLFQGSAADRIALSVLNI